MKTICSRCGSENDSSNMCCVFCGGELMKPKFYGSNDNQNNEYVQQVEQKKDMENEPHKPLEQPEPYTYVEEIDDTDDQYEIPVYPQVKRILGLKWDKRIKSSLLSLEDSLADINTYVQQYIYWCFERNQL